MAKIVYYDINNPADYCIESGDQKFGGVPLTLVPLINSDYFLTSQNHVVRLSTYLPEGDEQVNGVFMNASDGSVYDATTVDD